MARNKVDQFPEEPSAFQEGHVLHSWDETPKETRGMVRDVVESRSNNIRPSNQYNVSQKGKLYWPKETIPVGFEYAWVRIRLNNQDDIDNFHDALMNDWEPVPKSDHPEYRTIDGFNDVISERYPGSIRRGGLILVKKPKHMFEEQTEYYRQEAEADQRSSAALTEFLGNSSAPTHVVANSMKYEPNSRKG